MSSEDQQILDKISQLAGKINRQKNGHVPDQPVRYQPARSSSYGGYQQSSAAWQSGRGGYSARGFGRGGRATQVHRNRTLVLNGNNSSTSLTTTDGGSNEENTKLSAEPSTTVSAWVTKNDRHLQLINTAVFEKESQQRAKDMEQSRQQKLKQKDGREKMRFMKHFQRPAINAYNSSTPQSTNGGKPHEIELDGIRFLVTKDGSKLMKVPGESSHSTASKAVGDTKESTMGLQYLGDANAAKATPKTKVVHGVRFFRSKNGNLYRAGIIKAHRYGTPTFGHTRSHPYCSSANTFNNRRKAGFQKIQQPCQTFSTTGSCHKGPSCRFIHDPSKVAVCKEFLHKGSCPSGDACDLSHELTPQRTPACLHFTKGNCSNPNCRYVHVRVSPTALVCRDFGTYGYCEKGTDCTERHVNECPDFSNTGTCPTKGCKLLHRHKASVMRTNILRSELSGEDENSDISSDEEGEEIDDDDVDSDDLEEFFGDYDGDIDSDIPMQQDYVQLS
ncbi:related to YTH1 Protein of the 3` processing complex [Phialocephala subalpina]|uniref:Related to YTH1 Protein of the 3` processing complex n=1 Tax=Phialocephala subalpina TaxID=576137 RepID=A0A1L7WN38_9HELO|nr:related to YTH1 Protein of the 3` processing complex [Phialocephala subalpina]